MCRRVTVVVLCVCVCLSLPTLAATYLVYMAQVRFHRGVFKVLIVWLSLKMLCSKVLA